MFARSVRSFRRFRWYVLVALALGAIVVFIGLPDSSAALTQATLQTGTPPPPEPVTVVSMSDEACLECHAAPDMFLPLSGGEQLYLTIDRVIYKTSVHGREGYACVQCHTDITEFPHPKLEANDLRDVTLQMTQSCAICHPQEHEVYLQGDHAKTLQAGKKESAVCVDCHGSHQIQEFGDSRTRIAKTCQRCHADIYDVYKDSVHGAALLEEFNPDVPTCVDCHSNHSNAGPEERPDFHLFSPQICAQCHADEELMSRYEVNTDVLETYVTDFHGTTVTIFENIAPDQTTNKPVCIDCHGVHNIRPPDDAESSVLKQNLLETCQRCHPEATTNFPDAWLSHYPPDMRHNTVVFLVDRFYSIFIPATVGGMALFVVSDIWRRLRGRRANAGDK